MDQLDINLLRIKAALNKFAPAIEDPSDVEISIEEEDVEKIEANSKATFSVPSSPPKAIHEHSQVADAKLNSDLSTSQLLKSEDADVTSVPYQNAEELKVTQEPEIEKTALWHKIYKILRVFK
jgi:hypothetical protein